MAAENRLTKSEHIVVSPREIDFVTRFGNNWEALIEIMGIMRPIKKQPGAVLKSKYATVVLQPGSVAEGDVIPFSQATVAEKTYAEMSLEKYAKPFRQKLLKITAMMLRLVLPTISSFMNFRATSWEDSIPTLIPVR